MFVFVFGRVCAISASVLDRVYICICICICVHVPLISSLTATTSRNSFVRLCVRGCVNVRVGGGGGGCEWGACICYGVTSQVNPRQPTYWNFWGNCLRPEQQMRINETPRFARDATTISFVRPSGYPRKGWLLLPIYLLGSRPNNHIPRTAAGKINKLKLVIGPIVTPIHQ